MAGRLSDAGRWLLPAVLLLGTACDDEPRRVFVPVAPPEVELLVSASATDVATEVPVVLRAERYYRGEWKEVERASLAKEACWLRRPPPEREAEVADNLHWRAEPGEPARFNTAYRTDRTREVVFSKPGTYVLRAMTFVYCGPNKDAKPITIVVHNSHG